MKNQFENYQPSPEEVKKAEEMMMEGQKDRSRRREDALALSKEDIIKSLKESPRSIGNIKDEYRKDREVILAAVESNGGNLKYASPELRSDKGIVVEAVKNMSSAIWYALPELQRDVDVLGLVMEDKVYGADTLAKLIKDLQEEGGED